MADEKQAPKKLWGGRFTGKTDPLFEQFNESMPFDKTLWKADITGMSRNLGVHAKSLVPKC